jgi:valyl-tRNA synthetase
VNLKGLVEANAERSRIERELKKIDRELGTLEKKLGAPGFVDRAPPQVVEEAQAQKAALIVSRAGLEAARQLAEEL